MITIGTSYFKSIAAACSYYRRYEEAETLQELRGIVERKVAEGLIHIGKPNLLPGQTLSLIDGGTRYAIAENA